MSNIQIPSAPTPGGAPVLPPEPPVRYETGKGCLSFVVIGLLLAALTAAVIIFFGEPPTV